ncbi:MAG TPA: hypothetical protein P5075_03495 [Eubacteriales bacterium]|nr:hypothetical protein [Eubacteriales bacterium]
MSYYYVIGVRMDNRVANAASFQQVLTENGCKIKARLGLHEASADACGTDGMIILQPFGEKEEIERLVKDINKLEGVKAKLIDLN